MFSTFESDPTSRLVDHHEARRYSHGKSSGVSPLATLGQLLKKLTMRNRSYGLVCRLPFLILWTIAVIVILYKSICSTYPNNSTDYDELQEIISNERFKSISKAQVEYLVQDDQRISKSSKVTNHEDSQNLAHQSRQTKKPADITVIPSRSNSRLRPSIKSSDQALSSTKKSLTSDYSRRVDVFILIIQEEDLVYKSNARIKTSTEFSSWTRDDIGDRKIRVPRHIQHLTEIFNYHKISYTVDSTRFGIPDKLLSDRQRYSVIVIDNFLKYTHLSRWIRDQLDRHCRSHSIGLLTFLIDGDTLLASRYEIFRQSINSIHHTVHQRNVPSTIEPSPPSSDISASSENFRTLGEQFPISFKFVKQECNRRNSSCLINYQLNDKSPILRVLKRRPNFIIPGALGPNLNHMPYAVMSSNHVSYEPITWARMRKPQGRSRRHAVKPTKISASSTSTTSQHGGTHFIQASKKRSTQIWDQHYAPVGVPLRDKRAAIRPFEPNVNVAMSDQEPIHDSSQSEALQSVDHDVGDSDIKSDNDESDVSYEAHSSLDDNYDVPSKNESTNDDSERLTLSMLDRGLYDGIRRVIFGLSNEHWLNRILVLEAIENLSAGDIMSPLDRFIQIDIDDIFVGETGTRLNRTDVDNLIKIQQEFSSSFVPNFKFNLGFSGKYYKHGNGVEQLGDEYLIERANEFNWFCHFFSHAKAHLFNSSQLLATEIKNNLLFAQGKRLPLIGYTDEQLENFFENYNVSGENTQPLPATYAVAPHHSGVYPVHDQLYQVWRDLLNVRVTSTEEYPHLRPASARRAFVHKTIKVLPRQTCGLYTHTIFRNKYPGGFGKLLASINGGELFETVLHNPVNIYMTHMSNYANDRLALFTFAKLFEFVQTNTNLQLRYAPSGRDSDSGSEATLNGNLNGDTQETRVADQGLGPNLLAEYYFALNPGEREPQWTNPCKDRRHLEIWPTSKQSFCQSIPSALIVGPQKTGTTALYTFLKMNPIFKSSLMSESDYEEVQFFNDKHYFKGVDWYFERFKLEADDDTQYETEDSIYFDKSATYFDDIKAARRAHSLLPDAQIISILINPADRAYSWYQHMRAHGDQVASTLTFEQLLEWSPNGPTSPSNTNTTITTTEFDSSLDAKHVNSILQRCLHPGYFASHLVNWLNYYPTRQIIIIDGEWLKYNPIAVMNKLQMVLRIARPIDYSKLLVYYEQKGFYCQRARKQEQVKCLGSSKGRKYPAISSRARAYLNKHYWHHNRQLARLLYEIGQPLPAWLDALINESNLSS